VLKKKQSLSFFAITDKGNKRKVNEDSFLINEGLGLWVVADGMGGHGSGDVASKIATETIVQCVSEGYSLTDSIYLAHQQILSAARQGLGQWGMGTTVVALKINGDDYEIGWVGDSRAYLLEGQQMYQLTRDHSMVQEMVDRGEISAAEAEFHPQRNVIVQAVGSPEIDDVRVDVIADTMQAGDMLLLCSDGLTTEVSEMDIAGILLESADAEIKTKKLITASLTAGGKDNVTVVVVEKMQNKGFYFKLKSINKFIKNLF